MPLVLPLTVISKKSLDAVITLVNVDTVPIIVVDPPPIVNALNVAPPVDDNWPNIDPAFVPDRGTYNPPEAPPPAAAVVWNVPSLNSTADKKVLPVAEIFPTTVNLVTGVAVPMPTLPVACFSTS